MKFLGHISTLIGMCLISLTTYAQTITVTANPTNLPCGGGNVDFTAVGTASTPVFGDNFNNGQVAPGWSASPAAQFDNPCGPSLDGSTYLWMGPTTAAPRELTTAPVDVSCGGTVCFDFKFVCESCGDSSPCEGADLYNEGVSLQCSTDGGNTWTDFAYFAPNGDILTAYPGGVTQPSATGNTPFTTWQNYCFTIPAGCETANTMFQLHQWGSSGTQYDHWGIDNFFVYADPCAPYYYDWAHIPGSPDAPTTTVNVTQSGWYTCCYTDGTNTACDSVYITVQTLPNATVTFTQAPTCFGACDGEVIIDNPGGMGPYNITLSGPTSGSYTEGNGPPDDMNVDVLCSGTYTYVTTQQNGSCTNTGTFTIPQGPPCCEVTASGTDLLCNGDNSGSASATPVDGVAPYTYQWNDPNTQTTQNAGGLPAGTYSVIQTDAIGCQDTAFVTITEPTAVGGTNNFTNPNCLLSCDGTITANGNGGTPGYLYSLNGSPFSTNNNFANLCAGNHTIIIQDANGCEFTMNNITLTDPTDLTLTEVGTTVATCGGSDGSLTVNAGGGTAPYQYDIGGAQQGSGTFSNLAAGSYTVTVTDANGCTETLIVSVGSALGPQPFIDVQNDVACAGAFTGSVTIGVTNGTGPFTFTMLTPPFTSGPSNYLTGIPAGPFTVEVTDANGCTGQVSGTINEPSALFFDGLPQEASCSGNCDGSIAVTAFGATPPYTYSSDNGLTFQGSNILTGLCAGNIDVVVQDNNGCLANGVIVVGEPAPLSMAPTFVEPSCHGLSDGALVFNGSGGTAPYVYSTDDGATYVPGVNDTVFGIAAGWYELGIKDANGCESFDTITVTQPEPFQFQYIFNNPSNCGANDGSFEIAAINGVGPYLYSIDGGQNFQVNNGAFFQLYAGLYTLLVTDGNGCQDSTIQALSDNVMVTQTDVTVDATCFNSCDGMAIVSQQFGAPPYTYTLDFNTNSQPSGVFPGLCAGTHFVTITDDGLCLGIEQFEIFQPDSIIIFTAQDSVSCPAGSDGSITVTSASGGDGGPYQYSIDGVNFQSSNVLTGLSSGTYTVWAMDGNGCLGTDDITVHEPAPWNVNINKTDLVCNGDFTGFIQVIAGGVTPGYTYTLNGVPSMPANSGVFAGLSANPGYAIEVTDANGCTFDTTQAVNEPPVLTIATNHTDALCDGSADGTITVNAGGGTAPYLYSSDNGVVYQSGNVLQNLAANCYDVVVQDDHGCQASIIECVAEPTPVTMTLAITPATCGNSNGAVTITASGGTGAGYQYSNNNGNTFQPGNTFNNLSAAPVSYQLVTEDANGCSVDSLITLSYDPAPQIENIAITEPLCNGDANGVIVVSSTSGVGAHQYALNAGPFQPTGTFNGVTAGVYTVTVQDANGCLVNGQASVTEPALLTLTSAPTDLMCNGDNSGVIEMISGGGTPPHYYSVDNGVTLQGSGTINGLAAGQYTTYVEDTHGCATTGNEVLNEPAPLAWSAFNITDPICFGSCDGIVSTATTGGTAPFIYNWQGNIAGPNDVNASNVCGGIYSVYLTDANGCQLDSLNFSLTDPAMMYVDGVTTTEVLCFGGNTGTITVDNVVNGTAPYNYSFDGGTTFQANNVYGNIAGGPVTAGSYDITVMDANGCEALSNTLVNQPDSLYSIAPSNWESCYGENAVIQAFSNGGTVPYTYEWTNDINPNVETNPLFNHIITDTVTFTLVVTDANGCVAAPVSYTVSPTPPLSISPSLDTNICLGGVADLNVAVTGGQMIDFGAVMDYSYSWSPAGAGDTLSNYNASPTAPTTYTVTVADLCGQVLDTTIHVGINPDPVLPTIGPLTGCEPELISFDATAEVLAGYSIQWDFGNGLISNDPNPTDILYDYAGVYNVSVTITTDLGCALTDNASATVSIFEPPTPGFYFNPHTPSVFDPTVSIVDISQNADYYTYNFSGYGVSNEAEPTMTFDVEEETTILVCQTVTSDEGCKADLCKELLIHEEVLFYVPNAVTPDGDQYNQTFLPVFTSGVDPHDYHLTIFNRWGEIVFESYNYAYGWDCTYGNGDIVQDGVYVWQIEFGEKLTDKKQTHRGHVTVLR